MTGFWAFCAHRFSRVMLLCMVLALCGCGGGGGGGGSTQTVVNLPPSAAKLSDSNVALITVESGPRNNVNIPYVSVTLCVPGTSTCQTIDHVLLDTGSTGLRLFSSMVTLSLPGQTIGGSSTISECAQFLSALAWGPVKLADVQIGSKTAPLLPIQLMDTSAAPASCGTAPLMAPPSFSSSGTYAPLSANGILGVSLFDNDGQTYFNCASPTTTACTIAAPTNLQVQNPVTRFATDNNGVIVQMPALPSSGATRAQGYLIFGVNTQSNNLLGNANVVPVNAQGYFTTVYKGNNLNSSFMDSGSNGLFFNDAISTACTNAVGFYCPASTQNLSASIRLATGTATVNFTVANADTQVQSSNYAFTNLGGPLNNFSFDWGLPFFFGRMVYTVVENRSAGSLVGPFYAFTN